jgi:2-C-methyl-D-erythritol 4-phosphate cytidylyltransferase
MGSLTAKQYLKIGNKPILMHTMAAFFNFDASIDIVLVLPAGDRDFWETLCNNYGFKVPHRTTVGGSSRFLSVKNGLAACDPASEMVAIHDAVRPFVAESVIRQGFEVAAQHGSAIPVVPLKDSLRRVDTNGRSTFQDRQAFRLVQTPQIFQKPRILHAFRVEDNPVFTDDATVYEHEGWEVTLYPGNPENIKITSPEDMAYAEFLLNGLST